MSYSNYLEQKLLDLTFGGASFIPSGTLYIGLSSGNPGETGTSGREPTGNGYARVAVTNNKINWCSYDSGNPSGTISNLTVIEFPRATGVIGYIDYITIYDQPIGGNFYAYGPLSVARTIYDGDIPNFASGALRITLD
jgi:hypothetical protein